MSGTEKNVRVSFKLSREAAIKLREIALTKGELLCSLGVLAVQLGNESQICISSPLSFNNRKASSTRQEDLRKEKRTTVQDAGTDEVTCESASYLVEGDDKIDKVHRASVLRTSSSLEREVVNVDQTVAFVTPPSVNLTDEYVQDNPSKIVTEKLNAAVDNQPPNIERAFSVSDPNMRNALSKRITSRKQKKEAKTTKSVPKEETVVKRMKLSGDTATDAQPKEHVAHQGAKFDGPGLSFAQQLINLSKQYRQENPKSPTSTTNEKYFSNKSSQIVGRDHVLRYYNDKSEDFMGLNVNNSLLFDSYGSSSVKSAEELSKEHSEASPTSASNMDPMSESSPDSLFEEARLNNMDELSLSPTSTTDPGVRTPRNNSPNRSESPKSDTCNSPSKLQRSMKFQRLLKGQNGVVCELCMHPVQKSYSCYQMAYAPKEIKHLFDDGSRCVRVCRRCLPYKAPKNEKSGSKKGKKAAEYLTMNFDNTKQK